MQPPLPAAGESHERAFSEAVLNSMPGVLYLYTPEGKFLRWNDNFERVTGYTGAEIATMHPLDFFADAEKGLVAERIKEVFTTGVSNVEAGFVSKSGRVTPYYFTGIMTRVGDQPCLIGVGIDITERRRAEEARRASEDRYRTLFEYAPDGIVIASPESYYIDANPSICRMLGYSRDEMVGLHASDIVAPAETGHISSALGEIQSSSEHRREWRFRRKDGSVFSAEVLATAMPDGNLLGLIRDVTERKRIEARLRRLVDSNAQGVMFWNFGGEITNANDTFLKIVGYTREDLAAGRLNWGAMTPAGFSDRDRLAEQEVAATGVCTPYEKEYIRKDGTRVPVLLGAATFEDNSNEGVSFVLDISERKKLEQTFLRAQRMESIGTLAGGIAHDLNNVLSPILMSVEMLKDLARNDDELSLLNMLLESAHRGRELVKQVLSFARGVEGKRVSVNPLHLMRELLNVMRDTFPKSINVRFNPARDLWVVTGDPTQLHQVFLNLFVNARDAMPNGGNLAVTLENLTLDETYAAMNPDTRPGAYVAVMVEDSGTGMPPDVRDRIFEPFFTTKEIGKGTGLGLSTTIAIVKSHGGFINVYSEVGKGTTFKVYLPALTSEVAADEVLIEQTRLPRGNGELVLVVDDEEVIRLVAQRTLERFGYRVLLAAHGAEAVSLYARRQREIAVVLTDMAMPIMDGPTLIIALKAIDPGVRIIGSSGLDSNDSVARAVGVGVSHFVPKPYTAETLLKALEQMLVDRASAT